MIGVIVQARTGSTRFPRKIYKDINGSFTLKRVIQGVTSAEIPHLIILAMPTYDEDEFYDTTEMSEVTDDRFNCYFGDPDDLVERYYQAARRYGIDLIVRVTADCPLIQGKIIDEMLCEYLKNGYNGFMGNNELVSDVPYPDGVDVEIFPYWMLAETRQLTKDPSHREHVTPFMYRRGTGYTIHPFHNHRPNTMISTKFSHLSFDTPEDFKRILDIAERYDEHGDLNKAINDSPPIMPLEVYDVED